MLALQLLGCGPNAADPASTGLQPSDIQGRGPVSPYNGNTLTISGIVSASFQDRPGDRVLGGFYLQNLTADGDPATSDGLFVFDRRANAPALRAGDRVAVTGTVEERFGETQLVATEVSVTGRGTLVVTDLPMPAATVTVNRDGVAIADLERFEGMLLRVQRELYIQDMHGLERYGELQLSTEARQFQFTARQAPDRPAYSEHRQRVASQMLVLDDGRVAQNVTPVRYAGSVQGRPPRIGDAADGLQGVLRFSRGSGPHGFETWRLMPTETPVFRMLNPRPERPAVGGDIVIASVNVLNYFSTPDDGMPRCGPVSADNCRGADSAAELARQRAKTAFAITRMNADVVGLMEIENDASAAVDDLLGALNAHGGRWAAIDTGVIGTDAIRVALVYRADRVTPDGAHAVFDSSIDPRFNDRRNRPVLVQTFRFGDEPFTVAVVHLKSKGSPCDEDGDPDRGDGQGNCSGTRARAAAALGDWLARAPAVTDRVLVIGDFNAYFEEDPLRELEARGYLNLLREHVGTYAYSFVFRAQSGALDHAFASPALVPLVSGTAEWHINADEAPLLDYNLDFDRDPQHFDGIQPWRAADHDPLLVGLRFPPR